MIGANLTTHGNYVCGFCTKRKMYKTQNGMEHHLSEEHPEQLKIAKLESELRIEKQNAERRIANANDRANRLSRENELLRKPKITKKEYYDAIWYCGNCLKVHSGGLPKGTPITNVCCGECGHTGKIQLVTNVRTYIVK